MEAKELAKEEADIAENLTGNFTMLDNTASITFNTTADATTEVTEQFIMVLDNGESAITVYINDTSQTPVPTYTLTSSVSQIGEGSSFTVTLDTTNVADATDVYYTVTGVEDTDIVESRTGNFTITSNTDTITFNTVADELSDGVENFILTLNDFAESVTVQINDTSTEPSPTPTPS